MKRILSEPLLQFFVLGALLYATVTFVQSKRDRQSKEIDINTDRVALLINNYKNQMGVLPSRNQLDAMIDNYIREEISFREAKKLGLDRDDEIIRRRLSQKFEFVNTDLGAVADPTEANLRAFYDANPALFRSEMTVSFSHIYFSVDNQQDSVAIRRARTVLTALQGSHLQHDPSKGDPFPLQYDYTGQSILDIRSNFGDKAIVDSLFHGAVRKWIGPVRSGYGWHLVYISERDSSKVMSFASVKADVKQKYLDDLRARQNRETFDALSKHYIIKRNYLRNP